MALRSAALALGASVLLLAGCSVPPAPPPTVSDEQAAAIAMQLQAQNWTVMNVGGQDALPAIAPVRLTTTTTWSATQVMCLLAAGLPAREVSGGFTVDGNGALSAADSTVAQDTCLAQYPVDPRTTGYLSDEQVAYLYDYLDLRLAPCLAALGHLGAALPDRARFVDDLRTGLLWMPYAGIQATPAQWAVINGRCPPLPADPYSAFQPPVAG